MRSIILAVALTLAIIPVTGIAATADDVALLDFGGSKQQCLDELGQCGKKVVDLGQQVEKAKADIKEAEQECDEKLKDTIAISVGVGVFIGSGGLSAAVPVVGGLLGLPFILLGF